MFYALSNEVEFTETETGITLVTGFYTANSPVLVRNGALTERIVKIFRPAQLVTLRLSRKKMIFWNLNARILLSWATVVDS